MRLVSASLMVFVFVLASLTVHAQQPPLSAAVQKYVRVKADKIVLEHVRVIDGSGKAPIEDQNVVIQGGKIAAIQAGADVPAAAGISVLDLRGYSVMPGIVGMHNHLFYLTRPNFDTNWNWEQPPIAPQMSFSAPRLYLAAGVTTMRTTGSVETYADLNLKRLIDAGQLPGPHLDVTGPYLEGPGSFGVQLHELTGTEDARQTVDYWADQGVTSFKAYMNITRAELGAAIQEAHKRGIKVTGHLCSVTQTEAAQLGIDDLEHGPMFVDTEFVPGKQPDQCPEGKPAFGSLLQQDVNGPAVQKMMHTLIDHHVAVTSTLPVFELDVPGRPPLRKEVLDSMLPEAEINYLQARAGRPSPEMAKLFQKELQFEHEFAKAGGLLLAG